MKVTFYGAVGLMMLWKLDGDVWWSGWLVFLIFMTLIIGAHFWDTLDRMAAVVFGYTVLMGVWIFSNQMNIVESTNYSALGFDFRSCYVTFAFVMACVGFSLLKDWQFRAIERVLAAVCLIDSLIVIYQSAFGGDLMGLLANQSMNGCLIAVTYPFLCYSPEKITYNELAQPEAVSRWREVTFDLLMVFAPVLAIFLSKNSVPIGVFGVGLITWFWNDDRINMAPKNRRLFSVVLLGLLMVAAALVIPNLFFDSGRFKVYSTSFHWWQSQADQLTGTGPGSYFLIGPYIQAVTNNQPRNFFVWMHSDWMELAFQFGWLGLYLYLVQFVQLFDKCLTRKNVYLLSALASYGAFAVFNFPTHIAHTAFVGIFLAFRILRMV